MGEYSFRKDLISGEEGEEVVLNHIISLTKGKLVNFNKDNQYDFAIDKNGTIKTYEVKADEYCKPGTDRGNLFVEIECRGKNSGLIVTKADWFVFYLPYRKQIWYIETDKLRTLINLNSFIVTEMSGDKNSHTKGYLIPRRKFREYFKIYEI
jgi:hypothetical protein